MKIHTTEPLRGSLPPLHPQRGLFLEDIPEPHRGADTVVISPKTRKSAKKADAPPPRKPAAPAAKQEKAASSPASPVVLTVIHTADTHIRRDVAAPESFERVAHMAGVIKDLKERNPATIYVDGGDSLYGANRAVALEEGRFHPAVDIYNLLKPDVMEIGNHELQWEGDTGSASPGRADNLAGFLRRAGFPVICSNLVDEKTGKIPEGLKPYVLKEIELPGGLGVMKVAILGVVTQDLANRERHPLVGAGYDVTDPVEACRSALAQAKAEGAEKVIVLHHDTMDSAKRLAGAVGGIDVLVGAHDHRAVEGVTLLDAPEGEKTLYVNSGSYSRFVGELQLAIDPSTREITSFNHRLHPVTHKVIPDAKVLGLCRNWEALYARVSS